MDFAKTNIKEVLKHSLPQRFQDMPPTDFEDFIARIFKDLGYKVQQTAYSGDFGADLVIERTGAKIAVQVKRYALNNNVGVKDVNQVIGAKAYYKCSYAMIITTSDFTKTATELMNKATVDSWNWDQLQKCISDLYLDGKDVYEYFSDTITQTKYGNIEFEITKIEYNMEMKTIGSCTLVYAKMLNKGANVYVDYALPTYISKSNHQVNSVYWYEGYFSGGMVYSGVSVELAFMFRTEQVGKVAVGEKFIFSLSRDQGPIERYEAMVNVRSYKGCYIATLCYGNDSWEYLVLTSFRDNVLIDSTTGRRLISAYYEYGGILLNLVNHNKPFQSISQLVVKVMAWTVFGINSCLLKKHINK